MRWDDLFADLEAQLAAEEGHEVRSEVAERSRAERAGVHLADRLRAHVDQRLALRLLDGSLVQGHCRDVAVEWLVLDDGPGQTLVPVSAITTVSGLSRAVAPEAGVVLRRLGLTSALRALSRDRTPLRVRLHGATLTGTVDRVGADHLDLAEHPLDEPRRARAVRQVVAVRLSAVLAVHNGG